MRLRGLQPTLSCRGPRNACQNELISLGEAVRAPCRCCGSRTNRAVLLLSLIGEQAGKVSLQITVSTVGFTGVHWAGPFNVNKGFWKNPALMCVTYFVCICRSHVLLHGRGVSYLGGQRNSDLLSAKGIFSYPGQPLPVVFGSSELDGSNPVFLCAHLAP